MTTGTFQHLLQTDPLQAVAALALGFVVYLLAGVLPVAGVIYLIYFLLTLPMRRTERARLFLDLLELGLKEGRTPEAAITEAAASRDHRSLGVRFHLLAAYLEQGLRLDQALARVPRMLPPQIVAMLHTGQRIGDLAKVLPACRLLLKDSSSQVRGALNYLILLTFVVTPFTIFIPLVLRIKVLPAFEAIFAGMFDSSALPPFTRLVFASSPFLTFIQAGFLGLVWLATLAYVGGPRLRHWLQRCLPGLSDWVVSHLPWRRKRLQRDFSAMLAVLLEAEVPETEAVRLAGEATANLAMQRRAGLVCARLQEGVSLPEALHLIDTSGELGWRLANALRRAGGFVRALTGWHEALDAKAFQAEQAAAQITTTLLVLFNGAIVASIVIGIFLALIQLLNHATLW